MNQVATIEAINISKTRGVIKTPVASAQLRVRHGIVGDAHAADWHRQISLLAQESIDKMSAMGVEGLDPGKFAENITTKGICLHKLPVGTRLYLGPCLVEVTQIGKKCHQHCEIYKNTPHSYKELPLRIAEFGTVCRYEQSGELHGLTRVRSFTQDDAHIFCRPDQVKDEFLRVMDIISIVFKSMKFDNFEAQISLRDKVNREKYIGSEENFHAIRAMNQIGG